MRHKFEYSSEARIFRISIFLDINKPNYMQDIDNRIYMGVVIFKKNSKEASMGRYLAMFRYNAYETTVNLFGKVFSRGLLS